MSTPPQVAKPGRTEPAGAATPGAATPGPAPRRDRSFLDQIQNSIVVADGAMGTMLYSRGIFLNRCFDELCLSNPGLVSDTHAQ